MFRSHFRALVRSAPTLREGVTNGSAWAFSTVELLDEDFNKLEATVGDRGAAIVLEQGQTYEVTVDTDVRKNRLGVTIVAAKLAPPSGVNGVTGEKQTAKV